MDVSLPAKCFISHAYKDAAARDRLLNTLPNSVSPVVFPPIHVKPHEFVSKPLIDAVLDCEGLIYLRGGASDSSFWVAFERDYALRSGKSVFSYDIATAALLADLHKPLDLAVFAAYSLKDRVKVRQICDFLGQERNFDIWLDDKDLKPGDSWAEAIETDLADRLKRGGYVIAFWSKEARGSAFIEKELLEASQGKDRVLIALLEPCPVPDLWLKERQVQLYGDSNGSQEHRMDDLMVRMYWLIYQKTKNRGDDA